MAPIVAVRHLTWALDALMQAQHQLMTMCDELTTKLSVVSTFRDEIRTLRKSVETLETLYRSRPALGVRAS